MSPATRILHSTLIRLAKGMIKAWEEWLEKQNVSQEKQTKPQQKK